MALRHVFRRFGANLKLPVRECRTTDNGGDVQKSDFADSRFLYGIVFVGPYTKRILKLSSVSRSVVRLSTQDSSFTFLYHCTRLVYEFRVQRRVLLVE
jgi:hypothetical protein